MKTPLDDLVASARKDFGPPEADRVDWASVDGPLFDRIDAERKKERARFALGPARPWAYAAAAAVAMVAAVVVAGAGKRPETVASSPAVVSSQAATNVEAAVLSAVPCAGSVLVDGTPAREGRGLKVGDTVETRQCETTFSREGQMTVEVEPRSRLIVRRASDPLVLALEKGAVRAHVMPVPAGEAFAVDVASTRIAVHGTVLRVARSDDRAVVDVTEGVVSIGSAPRAGSVLGTLVTAPAHAELSVLDPAGTLVVSHEAEGVRSVPPAPVPGASDARIATEADRAAKIEASAHAGATPATHDAHGPSPSVSPDEKGVRDMIQGAVVGCMAFTPHEENVTVRVTTTLHLVVGEDGAVRAARFTPPVAPAVNGCASQSIYKARFPHAGSVSIPIEFEN